MYLSTLRDGDSLQPSDWFSVQESENSSIRLHSVPILVYGFHIT